MLTGEIAYSEKWFIYTILTPVCEADKNLLFGDGKCDGYPKAKLQEQGAQNAVVYNVKEEMMTLVGPCPILKPTLKETNKKKKEEEDNLRCTADGFTIGSSSNGLINRGTPDDSIWRRISLDDNQTFYPS